MSKGMQIVSDLLKANGGSANLPQLVKVIDEALAAERKLALTQVKNLIEVKKKTHADDAAELDPDDDNDDVVYGNGQADACETLVMIIGRMIEDVVHSPSTAIAEPTASAPQQLLIVKPPT